MQLPQKYKGQPGEEKQRNNIPAPEGVFAADAQKAGAEGAAAAATRFFAACNTNTDKNLASRIIYLVLNNSDNKCNP